jgi:hypothetical protein
VVDCSGGRADDARRNAIWYTRARETRDVSVAQTQLGSEPVLVDQPAEQDTSADPI